MAEETIYLCNFRVSVDGDWLCLRELADVQVDPSNLMSLSQYDDGQLLYTLYLTVYLSHAIIHFIN